MGVHPACACMGASLFQLAMNHMRGFMCRRAWGQLETGIPRPAAIVSLELLDDSALHLHRQFTDSLRESPSRALSISEHLDTSPLICVRRRGYTERFVGLLVCPLVRLWRLLSTTLRSQKHSLHTPASPTSCCGRPGVRASSPIMTPHPPEGVVNDMWCSCLLGLSRFAVKPNCLRNAGAMI